MILLSYAFRSIKDERDERVVLREGFTEPEIWSIILSICRALFFLKEKGVLYNVTSPQQILIDKEGLVLIDAHRLGENSLIEDNYVSRAKNPRYLPFESRLSKISYMNLREAEQSNLYSLGIIAL